MEWMHEVEVVIFDLDGTLYQDGEFHKRYLQYLLEGTPMEVELERVIGEAEHILDHRHPVKLGGFYHPHRDCMLRLSQGEISSAHSWDGRELERGVHSFLDDCLYVGDAWGVVGVLSRRLNISSKKLRGAFDRIRKDMVSTEHAIVRDHELMQAIQNLNGLKKKVLMTNTDQRNGMECVAHLGIQHLFDHIVYDAQKPDGMVSQLKSILEETGLKPHQVLSIGDNAWNDLHPVKKLGGRTAWISPYQSLDHEPWDVRLHTIQDLSQLLIQLQEAKHGSSRMVR